jgi:hypothetical protein
MLFPADNTPFRKSLENYSSFLHLFKFIRPQRQNDTKSFRPLYMLNFFITLHQMALKTMIIRRCRACLYERCQPLKPGIVRPRTGGLRRRLRLRLRLGVRGREGTEPQLVCLSEKFLRHCGIGHWCRGNAFVVLRYFVGCGLVAWEVE